MLKLYEAQDVNGAPSGLPAIASLWHNSWKQYRPRRPHPGRSPREGPGAQLAPSSLWNRVVEPARAFYNAITMEDLDVVSAAEVSRHAVLGRRPIALNGGFPEGFVERTSPRRTKRISPTLRLTVLGPSPKAINELRDVFKDAGYRCPPKRQTVLTPHGAVAAIGDDQLTLKLINERAQTMPSTPAASLGERDARDIEKSIGNAVKVTIENKASIVALATETHPHSDATSTCLLTGDATAQDIIEGLTAARLLTGGGAPFQCDIVKVQHHGAEFNYTHRFGELVVARHYVVSANGQHTNPDRNVIDVMIKTRTRVAPETPFTVWFTCPVKRAPEGGQRAMRAALAQAVRSAKIENAKRRGLVTVRVLNMSEAFFDICTCRPANGPTCGCVPVDATTTELDTRPD
jgi:hypothetical protein